MEKVREVLEYEVIENDREHDSSLTEIMHLIGLQFGATTDGWNREIARLFAIDTAMTAIRRDMTVLSDTDRHSLVSYLQEARALVVAGRDDELGFLQAAVESRMALIGPGRQRRLWLTAIDALIPSPYRAALVSTKNALSLATAEAFADLSDLLRERLVARLGEGWLLAEPTVTLHLTA